MHDGLTRFKTRFSGIPSIPRKPVPISYPYPLASGLNFVSQTPTPIPVEHHKSWHASPALMNPGATLGHKHASTLNTPYHIDLDEYGPVSPPILHPVAHLPRPSRSPRRGPPPPIDIASVNAAYPRKKATVLSESDSSDSQVDPHPPIPRQALENGFHDLVLTPLAMPKTPLESVAAAVKRKSRVLIQSLKPKRTEWEMVSPVSVHLQTRVNPGIGDPIGNTRLASPDHGAFRRVMEVGVSKGDRMDGWNGMGGKYGLNGLDGKHGMNGKGGQHGKDGQHGKNGQNGKDGIDGKLVHEKPKNDRLAKNRRKRILCFVLLILAILGIIIGLCVALIPRTKIAVTAEVSPTPSPSATSSSPAAAPNTAPDALNMCISDFGSSPDYPCGKCVPLLSQAQNDFGGDGMKGVGAPLQFCALLDFLPLASPGALRGWGNNTTPCAGWAGVFCDDRGRVLNLAPEATLSSIPSSISNIPSLSSIVITGNSTHPQGGFPAAALSNLTQLNTLQITDTALEGNLATMDFGSSQLTTLIIANNSMLGNSIPDLSTTRLVSLSYSGQNAVALNVSHLPSTLQSLVLSRNKLTGRIPDFATLPDLQSLYLDANNFLSPPTTFPNLSTLDLSNNPFLAGQLPLSICTSKTLTCGIRNTHLTGPGSADRSCAACGFASAVL